MVRTITSTDINKITEFCRRWKVSELALFGSALRSDFHAQSDFDFLISFLPSAQWGLLEHVQMQQELKDKLGRDVDLISKSAILRSRNWIRRDEILNTAQTIFSQPEVAYVA